MSMGSEGIHGIELILLVLMILIVALAGLAILHMRNQGEIDNEVTRRLEREMDLIEV
jgi:hypothetical protein